LTDLFLRVLKECLKRLKPFEKVKICLKFPKLKSDSLPKRTNLEFASYKVQNSYAGLSARSEMNSYRKSDRKVEFRSEISIVLYRNFGLGRLWAKSPAILNEILLRRDSIPQLIDSLSYKSIRTQIFSSLFVVAMLKVQVVCLPRPIQKLTSFLLSLGEVGSPGGRERSGGCGAHVPFPS